jgi:hypothetical protein
MAAALSEGLRRSLAPLVVLSLILCSQLHAQFYKVYPYGTADAGAIEISYWTSTVLKTNAGIDFFGPELPKEGLWAHSLELEYGLSHSLTVGYYADFLDPADGEFRYVKSKFVTRYRFADKYVLPVDIAFYGEYIIPDYVFQDSEVFELRLIIEKDIGPLQLDLNPIFEKRTSGHDVEEGTEFGYAAGLYYENAGLGLFTSTNFYVRPGLEFYGGVGMISAPMPVDDQSHYVFPTLDLYFPLWGSWAMHWHLGAGFGLTDVADVVIVKSIITAEFMF